MADGPGVIVAVVCRGRPMARSQSRPACDVASAHLKALLVLHALQAGCGDRVAAVVAADAASKEDMLEAYTARQIEAGGGGGGDSGSDVSTMPMFSSFQVCAARVWCRQLPHESLICAFRSLGRCLPRCRRVSAQRDFLSPMLQLPALSSMVRVPTSLQGAWVGNDGAAGIVRPASAPASAVLVPDQPAHTAAPSLQVAAPYGACAVSPVGLPPPVWAAASALASAIVDDGKGGRGGAPRPAPAVLCVMERRGAASVSKRVSAPGPGSDGANSTAGGARPHRAMREPCSVAVVSYVPHLGGALVTGFQGRWTPTAGVSVRHTRARRCSLGV